MYKSFLSWRYLVTRPTNFIGIVGIFVAVGALIMILSIMTGFLEQTKAMVRGGLSDLVITPPARSVGARGTIEADYTPNAILSEVRADPRIVAASPRLAWFGLIAPRDRDGLRSQTLMRDPEWAGQAAVQLVGVDIETPLKFAFPVLQSAWNQLGISVPNVTIQDEFDTTELFEALRREPHPDRLGFATRVSNPWMPFAPPPGYRPDGIERESIILGEQLMNSLQLQRGWEMTLVSFVTDSNGEVHECKRDYVIAGSFRTKDNEMDGRRIYMTRNALADLLNDGRNYTEVVAKLEDYDQDSQSVQNELREHLGQAGLLPRDMRTGVVPFHHVRTWEDFRETLLGAIKNERVLMAIMLSLILVVAGFTIFSILTMMVTEKRRDIGILAALGASPSGILWTFLLIGFWNALIGSIAGAIAGILGATYIDAIERWLSRLFRTQIFDRNVYYFDEIPSHVEWLPVTLIVLGAFACTLLFSAIPAWRAGRLNPLDALRYE